MTRHHHTRSACTLLLASAVVCFATLGTRPAAAQSCTSAQFEVVAPVPTPADLSSVALVQAGDGAVMVVVGQGGAFFVSHDLGRTFVKPALPAVAESTDWIDVSAPTPGVITASGVGVIVRSEDLGVTWQAIELPEGVSGPVAWRERETIIVAPEGNYTAYSKDAGDSWRIYEHAQTVGTDAATVFIDSKHGFGVGRKGMVTTADGGRTWEQIVLSNERNIRLRDIEFNDEIGVASGRGSLYLTEDGGETWLPIALDERSDIEAVSLPDGEIVYALARNGAFWRSMDGGVTFDVVELPEGDLTDLAFLDRNRGVITGPAGTLLWTQDGGTTWTQLRKGTGRTLQAVITVGDSLLAAGAGGTTLTSANGIDWTELSNPALPGIFGLATDGTQVVATAQNAVVYGDVNSWLSGGEGLEVVRDGKAADANIFSVVAQRAKSDFYLLLGGVLFRTDDGSSLEKVKLKGQFSQLSTYGGAVFVGGKDGIFRSGNGGRFERLGPDTLDVQLLAPISNTAVVARLTGGFLVQVDETGSRLLALEDNVPLGAAHVAPGGRGFVGAAHGNILRVEQDTNTVRLHPLGVDEAVVAILFDTERHGVALTARGRLFETDNGGDVWNEAGGSSPWSRLPDGVLGGAQTTTHGTGTLLFAGDSLLVGGPMGQVRKFNSRLSSAKDLDTDVSSDIKVLEQRGDRLYLGGTGRTVMTSTDDGASWQPITEDLAPEAVVGMRFEADIKGIVATDSGTLLRFGHSAEPYYELLGREPPPIAGLDDVSGDGEVMWLANGRGEFVFTKDSGETWDLAKLDPMDRGVTAFDIRDRSIIAVSTSRLRMGVATQVEGIWTVEVPVLPQATTLFSAKDQVLGLSRVGEIVVVNADASLACHSISGAPDVRDALFRDGGWVLVGRGGLIGRLETQSTGARQ